MTIKEFIENYTDYKVKACASPYVFGKYHTSIQVESLSEILDIVYAAGKHGCHAILDFQYDRPDRKYVVYWPSESFDAKEGIFV